MKLPYFQLEAQLAKGFAPVYIISGDELLLKQDAIELIRQATLRAGFTERLRLTVENAGDLQNQLYANSLLAEKRFIELDLRDHLPAKAAAAVLQEYSGSDVTVLVIDMGKIDDKIARSAWYKTLEKIGIVIAVWPISRDQLPQWIMQRARKYKLQLDKSALNLLADYFEGNLIAASQAIEKLYLLQPEGMITGQLIQTLLTDESHFTVFDFIDSLIGGDLARALHILKHLRDEGIEPTIILWAITRELRLLADYAAQIKNGTSYDALFQKQRIFARKQPLYKRFLTHFSTQDCTNHLLYANYIDKIIKGAVKDQIWNNLELFCLRMV